MLRSLLRQSRRAPGLLQVTEVDAHPAKLSHLLQALQVSAAVTERRGLALPLGGFYTELGSVGRIYLLQSFANYDSRELSLQALASTKDVLDATLEVQRQSEALRISIFMEPTDALEKAGLQQGLLDFSPQDAQGVGERPVYELRTYQLKLGYTTVPSFVEKYTTGLKDKLEADQTGQSQLVTLMYSESGAAPLNTVHELWRHRSMKGSQESRQASRAASGWKQAIAEIADLAITFHSQYLRPIPGIGRLQ